MNSTLSLLITATRRRSLMLRVALLLKLVLVFQLVCFAQGPKPPLTPDERAELLKLIRDLQQRIEKLEAAQKPTATTAATADAASANAVVASPALDEPPPAEATAAPVAEPAAAAKQDDNDKFDGKYTPNLGYKVVNTEYGDMNVSIYTYVRYLNQLGLDDSYTDAFGITKTVQNRQDIQLLKLQIKFLGWILNPKMRYFLYAWTSNANQGQGAQVVLAGNLQYTFNKYFTLGGGIRSLPGTRSVEGNFPFWLSVDSRLIADEFNRPSYTSGIWATGNVTDRLKYQVMLGNNMSTLGVPASRLDNGLNTVSSSLVWFPTGDFERGFSGQGWGDFEHHEKFSTRLGFHFSRSDENRESQPNSEQFENTQLRLSDGTVIFTPDLFGPGVDITDARYRMMSVDGGFKYRGFSLEGEYFWRWLDKFRGPNTAGVPRLFDHSGQIQASAMVVPEKLQAYAGYSKIFGQFGQPWDFRVGTNFFPFKNHVVRWNTEALYLNRSPVGYTSVPFAIGGRGWVFHSNMELAF
ncbi:MAG TPA: hypothetical protein VHQ94_10980 [Pyrinomonadaceae bacterium]|nr:hypothetical protein [Pyrinomonadaceae bacterium]